MKHISASGSTPTLDGHSTILSVVMSQEVLDMITMEKMLMDQDNPGHTEHSLPL
jgi:hypothetical protein